MPEPTTLAAFTIASIGIILLPGPNLIYIVTRSMLQGPRAGLASAAGVETATLVYVLLTAAGAAAVIERSEMARLAMVVCGAGYLGYLGIVTLRSPLNLTAPRGVERGLRRAYVDGAVVNLLNPKVALFFVAYLPQFVDTAGSSPGAQLIVLGVLFFCLAAILDVGYALVGGAAASRLGGRPGWAAGLRWVAGSVYLGLAAFATVTSWSR